MKHWLKKHKKYITVTVICALGLVVIVQLLYPSDRLVLNSNIDGVSFSGWKKSDAIAELDTRYSKQPISVELSSGRDVDVTPLPNDIGLTTLNEDRISKLDYPWHLRLLPSSLLWYGYLQKAADPQELHDDAKAGQYIDSQWDDLCNVKPVNANLRAEKAELKVVPSREGGTCQRSDVDAVFSSLAPRLQAETKVVIPAKTLQPAVSDAAAEKLAADINRRLAKVQISAAGKKVALERNDVAGWLTFTAQKDSLKVSINTKKAGKPLSEKLNKLVAVAPGTSVVKTVDFQEVSRQNGRSGRTLDVSATAASLANYLSGKNKTAKAVTRTLAPNVTYKRSYSKTDAGLSALMAHYAKDHKGTYAVQMIELSGARRRAGFDANRQFTTASTYKLFVAYSTLRRVESGEWKWSDSITGGKNLAKCFDDMIVLSDNPCAEALELKVGVTNLTNEAYALGCTSTSFLGANIKSTAADEALFLASLQSGQMLKKQSSRDKLLNAMRRNIYRQGIPAGASGPVANKVGFLQGLLHDAAVVYSPKGTYVLVILTDGSSWANIAELTRKIEALR